MEGIIDDSLRRWLESMEERKRGKKLSARPPWDENRFFDTPVETTTVNNSGAVATLQIAPANPNRVVLIMQSKDTSFIQVTTNVNGVAASNGFGMIPGATPWVLTQAQHGPVVTMPWFGILSNLTGVTVIEVILREWPT